MVSLIYLTHRDYSEILPLSHISMTTQYALFSILTHTCIVTILVYKPYKLSLYFLNLTQAIYTFYLTYSDLYERAFSYNKCLYFYFAGLTHYLVFQDLLYQLPTRHLKAAYKLLLVYLSSLNNAQRATHILHNAYQLAY